MLRYGVHCRLFSAHVQRRDEGDVLGTSYDGNGQFQEFSRWRAAFAAKAKNEQSSSGVW